MADLARGLLLDLLDPGQHPLREHAGRADSVPLHPDAGGSYAHNGVRRWQSRSDPEYQMLAEWIAGRRTGNNCSS